MPGHHDELMLIPDGMRYVRVVLLPGSGPQVNQETQPAPAPWHGSSVAVAYKGEPGNPTSANMQHARSDKVAGPPLSFRSKALSCCCCCCRRCCCFAGQVMAVLLFSTHHFGSVTLQPWHLPCLSNPDPDPNCGFLAVCLLAMSHA